jgi:tRNA 2-thiouridine synthesizing protein A
MKSDATLDCFGLLCPMPIIQTAQKIKGLKTGDVLEVLATDEGIKTDLPAWAKATGQEFLGIEESEPGEYRGYVRKIQE